MADQSPIDYERLASEAWASLDAGAIEQGLIRLEQVVALAAANDQPLVQISMLNHLALAQKRVGQLNQAVQTLTRALALLEATDTLEEHDARYVRAQVLDNLGFIERELGNVNRAQHYHEDALTIFEVFDDTLRIARSLSQVAIIHKDQGRLTEARASFERAITVLSQQDDRREHAHALVGLGLVFELMQRTADARRCYTEALALYQETGDRENEALTLHNIGKLYDNDDDVQSAVEYYRRSYAINRSIGAITGVVEDLGALAAILQTLGKSAEARSFHEQALQLQQQIGHRRGQLWTLSDLGIISRDQGDVDAAEHYLTSAVELAHELGDPRELYESYLFRGDARLMAGREQQAIADYIAAVDAEDMARNGILLEAESLGYFSRRHLEAYDRLVCLLIEHGDPRQSIWWSERARSRELLRRLRSTEIARSSQIPTALLEHEQRLLDGLNRLLVTLTVEQEADQVETVRYYQRCEQALQTVWQAVAVFDPEYVALRRGLPSTWDEIHSLLHVPDAD